MAKFFIHRPVFAWVLAIVTMLVGAWSVFTLPVEQYPDIAPTTIRITSAYPGATARAVQNSVTTPIEDALTGLDGLLYTESSSSTGRSVITLTFDDSVEPVDALNEVQSKVRSVESRLPSPVQNDGVSVTRSSSSILMVGSLVSTGNQHSTIQLGNLLEQVVEGPVKRTEGVGGVNIFGSGYAMRIWMDPLRLAQFQLTPTDITTAVAQQNSTVSVGSLGSQPVVRGQQFTANITAQSQLTSADDFRNILLKTGEDGAAVRLGDVAEVEIGQAIYGRDSRFNRMNASGFAVNLATGANAVETANAVRETLAGLDNALPEGVEIHIAYDTAPFVELSIEKVYETLLEAIALVFLVILLFLQNWRATLIPIIAIPVVLLGTFAMLAALGYSINTLTMFAMVLAIGLLVDDAIVVVENVERVMRDEGLDPVAATEKSMGQISGALVGIALVLSAVFLPMGFMPGSTGVIYRQFSVTIITAMVLSLLVALILTPAMCASLLRAHQGPAHFAPARWFNAGFARLTRGYSATVRRTLRRPFLMMLVLAAISYGAYDLFGRMKTTFIPEEDQGVLQSRITLTEGSTAQQTLAVVREIEDYMLKSEAATVESVYVALGFSFGGSAQNRAMIFVKLRDFDLRRGADASAAAIASRANAHFERHRAGRISFMQPPAIPRLGNSAGFSMYLLDQSGRGIVALNEAADQLERAAGGDSRLDRVENEASEDDAALRIDIDQQKAESFGVSISAVNAMLSTIFAGDEVNDFALGAQLRPVIVQWAAAHRMQPEDVDSWYARNAKGEMVPFTSFMTTRWEPVEPRLSRIDGIDAVSISGQPGLSASSGTAMSVMEELVAELPGGYGTAWTGLSYQERQAGNEAPYLFALSALVVFLSLAALYESWSIPFSVMLAVPVGVMGAIVAALTFGQANDVYFKVGILTTIGLASKNAILIVEFARELEQSGRATVAAAVDAARLRLRPILMTSLAFILGVTPLALATGAGAGAQNSIGIGVMGGMIAATFLGIFMVPAFYVTVRRLTDRKGKDMDEHPRLTALAHGGGCGCKLAPSVLRELLADQPLAQAFPQLLVGTETADDAAVWQVDDNTCVIATTDFFMPMVDDPRDFGRIAATNAISDIYAMGGRPIMALAILGMPIDKLPAAQIREILAGGRDICAQAGIPVAGGHSIDAPEPIYGLAVIGLCHPSELRRNADARPGDVLILTKGLGVGIYSAAIKKGALDAAGLAEMIASTTTLNKVGTDLAKRADVHAITDVTGFGILGHGLEIARGAGLQLRLRLADLPLLSRAAELAEAGFLTGASTRNWAAYGAEVTLPEGLPLWQRNLLTDPQTSGGLLVACAPEAADAVLAQIRAAGFPLAAIIGTAGTGPAGIVVE